MCWVGRCDVKIAKRDFYVYKIGRASDRFVLDWYLRSGYKPFSKKSNLLIKKLKD